MTTQTTPVINSHTIPTPGIENCRHYTIMQQLVVGRVRSIMTNEPFLDDVGPMIQQYLEVPPALQTAEEVKKYIDSEAKEVKAAFKKFEETTPGYADAIALLKPYCGRSFSINSISLGGVRILIEVEVG